LADPLGPAEALAELVVFVLEEGEIDRHGKKYRPDVNKAVYIPPQMETPFFPAFRARLAACGQRSLQTVRQWTLAQLGQQLRDLLPVHLLAPEDEGPHSRDRDYPLGLTLQCFLWQILQLNTSCREVVRQVQTLYRLARQGTVDEANSAYVQARQRLPWERMTGLLSATASAADRRVRTGGSLQGRPVKVADGSSAQAPDTAANRKRFPQPVTQKPGCGFPVVRFVALFSLVSGAILDVVWDSVAHHDLRLFHRLWECLRRGDIFLGDRAFGDYLTLAALPQRGVDVVARVHHRRRVDFRKTKRLGHQDGLTVWKKTLRCPPFLDAAQWEAVPAQITVRLIRFTATIRGQRSRRITLVTSLLDRGLYPDQELIALYSRRWRLELCFRDLKTTLGMEMLHCKTPAMLEKELLAFLIAHNLVRCVMAEAASLHDLPVERMSFKGTLDALRQFSHALAQARHRKIRSQLWADLLLTIARDLVPDRPHRQEPRALKRRLKCYPLLTKPRRSYREILHRNRYRKGKRRNVQALN
jgi:hypothetical protein